MNIVICGLDDSSGQPHDVSCALTVVCCSTPALGETLSKLKWHWLSTGWSRTQGILCCAESVIIWKLILSLNTTISTEFSDKHLVRKCTIGFTFLMKAVPEHSHHLGLIMQQHLRAKIQIMSPSNFTHTASSRGQRGNKSLVLFTVKLFIYKIKNSSSKNSTLASVKLILPGNVILTISENLSKSRPHKHF